MKMLRFCIYAVTLLFISVNALAVPVQDATKSNLSESPIKLDGDWDFYWSKLLTPDDINSHHPDVTTAFPKIWNELEIDNKPLPPTGYATYRKIVKLSADHPRDLSLKLKRMKTSYKLFVNGELIANRGEPGVSKETTVAEYIPLVVDFHLPADETEIDIVIQMANYIYPKGGMDSAIMLGEQEVVHNFFQSEIYISSFLAGGLLLMGCYHFGLFAIRRTEKAVLLFGLFCLCFAMRPLTTGAKALAIAIPSIPIDLMLSFEIGSVFIGIAMMHLYVYYLFPDEYNRKFYWLSVVTPIITFIAISLTSPMFYGRIIFPLEIYGFCVLIHSSIVVFYAYKNKRDGRFLFTLGILSILITGVNDILFERGIMPTTFILPYGVLLFVFAQAVLLSVKFTRAFKEVEDLKESLEIKVQERTKDLEKLTTENRMLSTDIINTLEEERKQIASDIHDNFSADMAAIKMHGGRVLSLAAQSEQDEIKNLGETIQSIAANAYTTARHLIRRLRPEIIDTLGLDGALTELVNSYNSPSYECKFECHATDCNNLPEDLSMSIYRIAHEAITNTIKHSEATKVVLNLGKIDDDHIQLNLSDNGKGFDSDTQTGIGMISMRERTISCGGDFDIKSVKRIAGVSKSGTTVTATFDIGSTP